MMRPHSGSGLSPVTGSGVLMLDDTVLALPLVYTPSTWSARLPANCCEKPTLAVWAKEFTMLSLKIVMLGGAVDANVSGSLPPYGSGYDGFRMVMLL